MFYRITRIGGLIGLSISLFILLCCTPLGGDSKRRWRVVRVADWLMEVVPDPSYGKAREMLLLALARLVVNQRANDVLLAVFDQLPGHAAAGLAESGGLRELKVLRDKRDRYKGWVKKEIDRAVRSIAKRLSPVTSSSDLI